jgi:alkaline phosphatase D
VPGVCEQHFHCSRRNESLRTDLVREKSGVRLSRRTVMVGGAAIAAGVLSGCDPESWYPHDIPEVPLSPAFPMGVASGDVRDRQAVLWTRYLGSAPLHLSVSLLHADRVAESVMNQPVMRTEAGFVHARVDGLIPGARYAFAFEEDGGEGASASGEFRAAIAPMAAERLVFSASACSRNRKRFGALLQASARSADLHVLLGDTVYADGSHTLDEYRAAWLENLGTGAYRTLRARRSLLATWDDHEIANDWNGLNMTPELLENGRAAFFEHTPLRRDPVEPWRLWRSARWGLTAEFFVLDGRSERRAETRGTPEAEYISQAQLNWLKEGLKASPARFKVLVNSVPIGNFPDTFVLTEKDRWSGYRAQREDLLSFIEDNRIPGVFFVSGDFHMASLGRVSNDGPGSSLVEVLAGPVAATRSNPIWEQCRAPMFQFASATENTAFFELDPDRGEVRVTWLAADGSFLAERFIRV